MNGARPLTAEHQSVRETLIQAAIDAGKFPESRATHWRAQFDRDPEGTKHWLACLTPLPDIGAAAQSQTPAAAPEEATYDPTWLAASERARISAARSGEPRHTAHLAMD